MNTDNNQANAVTKIVDLNSISMLQSKVLEILALPPEARDKIESIEIEPKVTLRINIRKLSN